MPYIQDLLTMTDDEMVTEMTRILDPQRMRDQAEYSFDCAMIDGRK